MREIIHIQIQQCGNNIGTKFWEHISQEHRIDKDGFQQHNDSYQSQNTDVYFDQSSDKKLAARCILVDSEPATLDSIKANPQNKGLFDCHNFVSSRSSAGNNWAKGYYSIGSQLADKVMEIVQKLIQNCQSLQGFQIIHSIGGGTGSGMGSLLNQKLCDKYANKIISTFPIFSSQKISDCAVSSYNSVLSIDSLIQNAHSCVVIDNEALHNICNRTLKIAKPTYSDFNNLASTMMSSTTACFRFPGILNPDIRKFVANLVPYPRLHFLMVGHAPLTLSNSTPYRNLTVPQLIQQMFDAKNMMCAADPRHGRYLTSSVIFRGDIAPSQIHPCYSFSGKNSSYFVEWVPNNIKYEICRVPLKEIKSSATFIGNSTSISQIFQRTLQEFDNIFKRKAFLHWYTDEGLDESELIEAQWNIRDLLHQYQLYQDATVDDWYQNEEEEAG